MIVTISGAACTGKTTLINNLKDTTREVRGIHYYEEFIRSIFSVHYSNKYKDFSQLLAGDPIDIINIHKETARLFNEVLWSSNLDDTLIFDRSPLDISIYMYLNLKDVLAKDSSILDRYREASNYIYRCISDFMNHNPILLYTRPFSDYVESDGFRPMSLVMRRELELSLFDKEFLSLPKVIILPGVLEDRIEIVKSIILH